jgi:imidazolonepropionase-like amidohydrolase
MPALQAIEAATRVAAEACGVSKIVGTLEPGKEADLLVVDGDPLESMQRMACVQAVYKAGQRVTAGSLIAGIPVPGATA